MTRALVLVSAACLLGACASRRSPATTPQMSGVLRQSVDVTETISLAQDDAKEVKEFHRASMSILDRLDYKTQILLR
jgi:hypothetical protein